MKQNEVLFLLGSVCVVVFAWIAFTILHNSLTSTIGSTTLQAISPITPSFNTKVIDAMKERTPVTPLNVIQQSTQNAIVVTGAPLAQPTIAIATPSAHTASTGGTLQ